jgi:DNA-binding MarR family transcriptional regulator
MGADDYRRLSDFRYAIRCFLEFSEQAAQSAGVTSRQHQALLAIKGKTASGTTPSVGVLAERLRLKHHSAVELVNRLDELKLLRRHTDPADQRRMLLSLTPKATLLLDSLTSTHLEELRRLRPALQSILEITDAEEI